ncbi:MAG: TRAP transporter substrate-binding protein [Betaproteobacteria bacterium]|nr:TRAP transporter substrate-binding protein [Betaproteobacteria bacterium]
MKSIAALRAFVLGALSALALPAAAEQIVLKVHHFLPATSNAQVHMIQPWCDKVNRESGDRIKCQIYPAMQLGGTPQQLFDQLRDGVVDMIWTVPTYAAGRFSKAEVFELPFIVTSAKAGSQALWQYVQKNAMDEFKGVRPILLHVHDGSVLHLTSKQVKTLEDLRGLKIRAATRINARMLAALGATPVQMPLPQVAEALSKGVIDGAMVPWEGMPALKLHEITKYHVEPPAGTPRFSNAIFLFGMNPAKYDSLPPDLKKVIDANSGAAMSAWAGERWDATVEPHRKLARDRGNQFYTLPEAENARWVKATENVDDDWVKEVEKKGADGKRLVGEARQLVGQFSR